MKRFMLASLVVALVCVGCGEGEKVEDVPPPQAPPPAKVFSFTNTTEVATADEIGTVASDRSVRADFNLDGLQDLAVIEPDEEGDTHVTIYIRRPMPEGDMSELVSYYKGGWIRPSVDGDVIGVMSSRRDRYTDLILLLARADGPNAMVHFHSDGNRFTLAEQKK